MTDELSRVIHNLGHEYRPDSPYSRRLVLAGFRAGLEEAASMCREEALRDDRTSAATMNNMILSKLYGWNQPREERETQP